VRDHSFVTDEVEQLRGLKLVPSRVQNSTVLLEHADSSHTYTVEIWQRRPAGRGRKQDWTLVSTATPLRRGKPLSAIPFVFHGPSHSRAEVERPPIDDLVAANLDHYRLNTDYKHGRHFTALPTAFVSGFDKGAELRIGATTPNLVGTDSTPSLISPAKMGTEWNRSLPGGPWR
jgi:hypothetical protein